MQGAVGLDPRGPRTIVGSDGMAEFWRRADRAGDVGRGGRARGARATGMGPPSPGAPLSSTCPSGALSRRWPARSSGTRTAWTGPPAPWGDGAGDPGAPLTLRISYLAAPTLAGTIPRCVGKLGEVGD